MALPEAKAVIAVIGMGANVGNPQSQVETAFDELARLPGSQLLKRSSHYLSAPVGKTDQPAFINAAALVQTTLAARALLEALLAIEQIHGRLRMERNGPRTLDLDLLLYGDQIIEEPGLLVPHPRMHERRFALEPLVEICPGCIIPRIGPAAQALARVCDQDVARKGDPA